MRTTSEQKEKIKRLKGEIKTQQNKITDLLSNLDVQKEAELPAEEQEKNKQEFKNTLALQRAAVTELKAELKSTRLNKTGSSFFEFTPHQGMNRQQARRFKKETAKQRRYGKM